MKFFIALLVIGHVVLAVEDHKASEKSKGQAPTGSGKPVSVSTKPSWKDDYKKLKDSFAKIGVSLPVKAEPAVFSNDKKDKEFNFTEKMRDSIIVKDGVLDSIYGYREKLTHCASSDASSKELIPLLDGYINHLNETFGENPIEKKDLKIKEKIVNTYTLQMIRLLAEKEKAFSSSKENFSKSDESLKKNLKSLAGLLWGSEAGEFSREGIFTEEMARKEENKETKSIVEVVDSAVKNIKHQAEKTDNKACRLDSESSDSREANGKENPAPEQEKSKKSSNEGSASETNGPESNKGNKLGAGINGNNSGNIQNPTTPGPINGGTPFTSDLGEGKDLNNAIGFQQLQNENDLLRQLLDQQQREEDKQDAQLAELLKAFQRPNNIKSAEKSTQGPQISPSIGGGRGQEQQPTQPQMPQIPQAPQMMPYMPQQQQQLPLEMFKSNKTSDEDRPRSKPVVVEDPKSSGILDMLKMQSQMLQQMMMNGGMYNNGVQNLGQRLQSFGGSVNRGLRYRSRTPGASFNGTALSGAQGRLQVQGARAPIPSAVLGR